MINNQLTENSVNQLLNSVRLARDNAERADNRVDHSFYYALTIALEELQERRKADSEPVAWTDEEELRDANESGSGYLFGIEREANKFADPRRQIMLYRHAQPAPASMEDHQIRELVNELRDISIECHGTQQLRERIARTVRAAMLNGGKS